MQEIVLEERIECTAQKVQRIAQKKTGILLVAYGSSNRQASSAVRAFQARLECDFSMPIRLAFTSETMRMRLAHARTKSDSVLKALEKMYFERFTHVAVQTLHLIPGLEYHDVLGDIDLARKKVALHIKAGKPLLSQNTDMSLVAKALQSLVPQELSENDFLLWMGHGTEHDAKKYYDGIACAVNNLDPRLFIACMAGKNTLDAVLHIWRDKRPEKVWLLPLLTTIGRHALHDMAGTQENSWKSQLEKAGYACEAYLHGLAESKVIQDIWIERLRSALVALEC